MPHRSFAVSFLVVTPLFAQQWVQVDDRPLLLDSIVYDRANQRLIGITRSPLQTWSFDGAVWHLHSPDGFNAAQRQSSTVHAAGYDEGRGQVVVSLTDWTFPYPTVDMVLRAAGWQTANTPSTLPDGAPTAFDPVSGQLIAFGGRNGGTALDTTFAWNGTAWTTLSPSQRPSPRMGAAMATDRARNRVVLYGGADQTPAQFDDTWEWDGTQWHLMASSSTPLQGRKFLAYDPVAQRVVMIRESWTSPSYLDWDGTQWSPRPPIPYPFSHAYDDGTALYAIFHGDVWRANGTAWTLASSIAGPNPLDYPAMVHHAARGETVAVTFGPNGGTWRWNGSWQFATASGPGPRQRAALGTLGNDVVLFGGFDTSTSPAQLFDDTWSWNGQVWSPVPVSPRPGARHTHAMVETNNGVVLFGGHDLFGPLNDTWRFDGSAWTNVTPASSPYRRMSPAMAFDPLRQRVVLFGGRGLQNPNQPLVDLDDTWEWDGTTWTQSLALPPLIPPHGVRPVFAFDPVRGQCVLAYGSELHGWNGTTWNHLQSVAGEAYGVGVFDTVRQRLLAWNVGTKILTTTPATASQTPQSCGNAPDLRLFGRPALGATGAVHVEGAPLAPAFLVYGLQAQTQTLAPGCDRMVAIDAANFVLLDAAGRADAALTVPAAPAFRGIDLFAQAAVFDGGPVGGLSLSGALHLVIGD